MLVADGVRVTEIAPQRRGLEQIVLEVTADGSDRIPRRCGRPRRRRMIRVELVKLVRRPRTWISIALLCALPIVVAAFVAARHLAPAPGQGPAFLSAVLRDGSLYPAAAMAMVVPVFLPDLGRGAGR